MEVLLQLYIRFGYTADEMFVLFKKYGKDLKYVDWKNILKIIWGLITKRQLIVTGFKSGEIIEKIMNNACRRKANI